MADRSGVGGAEINRNSSPFLDNFDVMKSMTVPESIKVSSDSEMNSYEGDKPRLQGTTMQVPERIILDGDSGNKRNPEIARDFQGVTMSNYMGGMVTPPRTLTVDDTTAACRDTRGNVGKVDIQKTSGEHMEKNFEGKDRERLLQDYFHQQDKEGDDLNFRLQTEIVRLNNRVTWLEKRVHDKELSSFWKTTLVCLLTIINPVLVHWLFTRRR